MKTYPTISRDVLNGMSVYAFAKLDGSNVRAEWSRKQGSSLIDIAPHKQGILPPREFVKSCSGL